MNEPAAPRRSAAPALLLAVGLLGAVQVGLWLSFRERQPSIDARTRARLRPRGGGRP